MPDTRPGFIVRVGNENGEARYLGRYNIVEALHAVPAAFAACMTVDEAARLAPYHAGTVMPAEILRPPKPKRRGRRPGFLPAMRHGRCPDCGARGERRGHMTCAYPVDIPDTPELPTYGE